jgi:hypothetical protein
MFRDTILSQNLVPGYGSTKSLRTTAPQLSMLYFLRQLSVDEHDFEGYQINSDSGQFPN